MSKHTLIVKSVDKSKCQYCGSNEGLIYFRAEDLYWCAKCKYAYRFEEYEIDESEKEEIVEWDLT